MELTSSFKKAEPKDCTNMKHQGSIMNSKTRPLNLKLPFKSFFADFSAFRLRGIDTSWQGAFAHRPRANSRGMGSEHQESTPF